MRLLVATKNSGKIQEIAQILSPLGIEVVSQGDTDINVDIEETGSTFQENALIKARAVAMMCDEPVLADDSGLCVEALDGAPGIHSARYAGSDASDMDKIQKLLGELEGVKNRRAKFVCVMAMVFPDGEELTASGEVSGSITTQIKGEGGFGYDPIFYADELKKTFAEAGEDEKNRVSHRSRALHNLVDKLNQLMKSNEAE